MAKVQPFMSEATYAPVSNRACSRSLLLDTHACDAYNDIKSKKAGMIDGRIAS